MVYVSGPWFFHESEGKPERALSKTPLALAFTGSFLGNKPVDSPTVMVKTQYTVADGNSLEESSER